MDWSTLTSRLRTMVGLKPKNEVITNLTFEDFRRLFILDDGDDITPETALRAIPVQACVALIAGGITSMPLRVVRRDIVDGVMTQTPADSHDYWWLFNEQPNDDMTSALFWEEVVKRKVLWGRAFARIIRPNLYSNKIRELVFVPNENVQVECEWDPIRRRDVITRYLVRDGKNTFGVLPSDMLDFRGRATVGYPAMSDALYSARNAVAMVLTIEQYCAKFFANGGMPRMVLSYPATFKANAEQQQLIRESFVRKMGGPDNAGVPFILTDGGEATKLSFTAEEAQMLEARKFQVIEIARAFGAPPFMIGETEKTSAWGSGIEQLSQGFIRYTLGPHITAIEQEINRKLFGIDRFFVDFDEEALSRGDMKSLGEWFRQAIGGNNGPGFMTVNEVRSRLKLPPVDGGMDVYVPAGGSNAQDPQPAAGDAGSQSGQAAAV